MFIHNYQINKTIVANMVNLKDLPHVKDIENMRHSIATIMKEGEMP